MTSRLLALAAAAAVASACTSQPTACTTSAQQFQQATDALRTTLEVPGLTAAVVLADGSTFEAASGLADREAATPMRPDHRLLAASIGKTFVAATALALARDGTLALDQQIGTWLGDESWFKRLPNARHVTVRMLANHTSGIPNHADDEQFLKKFMAASDAQPRVLARPEDAIQYVLDKPALFPAGQGLAYGDTNYILLGMVLERATGKSFYALVDERFIKPLALSHTGPSTQRRLPGLTAAYLEPTNPFGWPEKITTVGGLIYEPDLEWTGGGFASTAGDLARWAKALYEGKAMAAPYVDEMVRATPMQPGNTEKGYGLGVAVVHTARGPMYGHGGDIPGYSSIMGYFPARKVAVAAMTNINKDEFPLPRTDWALRLLDAACGG